MYVWQHLLIHVKRQHVPIRPGSSLTVMSRSFTFNTVPMKSPLVSLLSTVCTYFPPGFRDPPPLHPNAKWFLPEHFLHTFPYAGQCRGACDSPQYWQADSRLSLLPVWCDVCLWDVFPRWLTFFCVCIACISVCAAPIVSISCLLVSAALQTPSARANVRSPSRQQSLFDPCGMHSKDNFVPHHVALVS